MNITEWKEGKVYDIGDRVFVTAKLQFGDMTLCIPVLFVALKKLTASFYSKPMRDGSRGVWEPSETESAPF